MTKDSRSAQSEWRRTAIAAVLNVLGMPLDLLIGRSIPGAPVWPDLASAAVGLGVLWVLFTRRRRPSVGLAEALFVINVLAIVIALWFSNGAYARSGHPWVPFQATKLGMLAIALLAPRLRVGLPCIGLYLGAAVIQLMSFDATTRTGLAVGEPWATLGHALIAAVLLVYLVRRLALEREVARARAEAAAMQRLARVLIAIRDLANSPLQTIVFATAVIRQRRSDLEPVLQHIDHALHRLDQLDEYLRCHEDLLDWTVDHQESLETLLAPRPAS